MPSCPSCQAPLATPLVCTNCNALQDCEGELGPYEAMGLEPDWVVEPKQLKRTLLQLSRFVHPDYFATAEEETLARAERASAALNSAYEILDDDLARADYLVNRLGGPKENEERQMPQPFLIQVMEWNEILEDAQGAQEGSDEWNAMKELGTSLTSERAERIQMIGDLLTPLPDRESEVLTNARREINAIRYIDRAQRELKNLQLNAALGGSH